MAYIDKYCFYYELLKKNKEEYIKKGKRLVIGYTSDLDVILEWDQSAMDDILAEHLKSEPALGEKDAVDSMESFARIAAYYAINGLGGETDVTDESVARVLRSRFQTKYGLGGTCAQQAVAIGKIGVPALVHITDRSKEVIKLMDGVGLETVSEKGVIPLAQSVTEEPPVIHMILQYPKGDKITVLGRETEIPLSNRLILDIDTIHKFLPIDKPFLDYCENYAESIAAYSISGFNAILEPSVMRRRTKELALHFENIKKKNPECRVYLEGAFYLNPEVKDIVFGELAKNVDFLGMNEEELVEHVENHGRKIDKNSLYSVLDGLEYMLGKFPVNGIVLHTKDYSMYYGAPDQSVDIEMGLTMGNLLSGTRARIGDYGSYEDCAKTIGLPLSGTGLEFAAQLSQMQLEKCALIVPSRYMEHPQCTIGLGDTFVAGFLTAFVD